MSPVMTPWVQGTGLFSAKPASLRVSAPRGATGVRFHCAGAVIPARVEHVSTDASWAGLPPAFPVRNTTLALGGTVAATVEHALSALAGLGIWHADVFLEGVEAPILDGSAAGFASAWEGLGCAYEVTPLVLTRRVEVRDEKSGSWIVAEPLGSGEGAVYTYELDYGPASPVRAQRAAWDLSARSYTTDVAPARTFSLLHEVEAARRAGLFGHLTTREMLVVGADGQPIDNAWRFPDPASLSTEPARHKLLDLIGDLALLGRPLHARVTARRSGHAMTHQFCRAVLGSGG
ncbi:MAG: UDP-3-O-acyl-N-acetylglucosamine deacetylase [Phycisphaerales bacterium]